MQTLSRLTVIALILLLVAACAPAAPTAAPTKPPAAPTVAPAAPTKPAAAAPTPAPAATPKPAAPTVTPASKIKRGGILTSPVASLPTLDPHLSNTVGTPTYIMLFNAMFRSVLLDPEACYADAKKCQFEMRGELVEKWEAVDPVTYIYRLRQKVKFHDGSDWNAEVAKWNLERLGTHPKSLGKGQVALVKSLEVVDPYTLKVNLKERSAVLPFMLTAAGSVGRSYIISKAAIDKLGDDEFGRRAVGSGPFKLKEWRPDQRVDLERFEGYWDVGEDGKPLPYLDGAVLRHMLDIGVRALELRAGNIDVMWETPLAPDIPAVKADPNLGYWEWLFASSRWYFIINAQNSKNPILGQDLKLRQALAHSIDREAVTKSLGLGYLGSPAYYIWTPGTPGYDETLPRYDFNLDKARQLLKESGYAGQEVGYLSYQTEGRKFGELLQQMFRVVGIRLELTHVERLAWVDQTRAHNYDTAELSQPFSAEPAGQTRNLYTHGLGNYEGQQNPEMDKCMDEGGSTEDPKKRHEAYRRCEQINYEMAYRIPVYTRPSGAAWRKYVKGITSDGLAGYPNLIWLDK